MSMSVPTNKIQPQSALPPEYLLMAAAARDTLGKKPDYIPKQPSKRRELMGQNGGFQEDPKFGKDFTPEIQHEDKVPEDMGNNFENLYKKLDSLKDKVKPGNLLHMQDKQGYDYYYQRDDDYEHGFSYHPKLKAVPTS